MIEFKYGVDARDLKMIHPALWIVLTKAMLWCKYYRLPFEVTSIIRRHDKIGTTATHKEGRAFDMSIKGFSKIHKHKLVHYLNSQFEDIGAVSQSTGLPRVALLHNAGYGEHIHVQVRPDADWASYIGE